MVVDALRDHWLGIFLERPVGFFPVAAVFLLVSGLLETGRQWKSRALRMYGLHLSMALVVVALAGRTSLGREVERAVEHPWETLGAAALLNPQAPLLDLVPLYLLCLVVSPWLLRQFEAGRERVVLGGSFLFWLGAQWGWSVPLPPFSAVMDGAAWQMAYVPGLYLGHLYRVGGLERPAEAKWLRLSLFGLLVALGMLRHGEVFGLQAYVEAIPGWWVRRSEMGPLLVLNLYLWLAFLWLAPGGLGKLVREGRVFVAMGQNAMALVAWQMLVVYVTMIWLPPLYRFTIAGQALVVSFVVGCLVLPVSLGVSWAAMRDRARRHSEI